MQTENEEDQGGVIQKQVDSEDERSDGLRRYEDMVDDAFRSVVGEESGE